jgi:site-specific recombinase XerD
MRRSPEKIRVKTVIRDGKAYHYARAPAGLIRLPDLPKTHPKFLAAYRDAMGIPDKAVSASLPAAIGDYMDSADFTGLAASTQAQRRRQLMAITSTFRAAAIEDLQTRHIEADLAPLEDHAANARLKAWRGFLGHAMKRQTILVNPSDPVKRRRIRDTGGHAEWTVDDVAEFRDWWHPETPQRRAFEVIHWTGARMSDAVTLGAHMVDKAGWLVFQQQKTGGEVAIPFARELPQWAAHMQPDLDALRACVEGIRGTWLQIGTGRQRSIKAATQWFAGAARDAGVEKTGHGLRKLRAMTLAEAGASAHQIAAWLGHESLSEVQRYARRADRRRILG